MRIHNSSSLLSFLLFLILLQTSHARKKSFIAYLGEHTHSPEASLLTQEQKATDSHHDLLGSILGSKEEAEESIFYSYTKHINGFAAIIDEDVANQLSKHPDVVSVFENRGYKLHTTRSWEFMGLESNGAVPMESLWNKARFGEDTIIANFDTGVWPESKSFADEGLGPVPSKWTGKCEGGVTCNRKLIGARFFNKGYLAGTGLAVNSTLSTSRDNDGHGSHTLSTAAGAFVPFANVLGYGTGTAKGGSPRARVASYKVCWPAFNGSECFDADIISAFDAAIRDGAGVLSLSIGGNPVDYFSDGIAIGSFSAVRAGIAVVCSAGNSGPAPATVSNNAPWIITVGASTMDREFPNYVSYGNKIIKGQSLSARGLKKNQLYPLIRSPDAAHSNSSIHDAELCFLKSLDPVKLKGKIVVCTRGINPRVEKGEAVFMAGGAGMVLVNDPNSGNELLADAHVLPATHITYEEGVSLFSYLNSTKFPMGYISKPVTKVGTKPAPVMAAFSSQGPNTINPEILKPDITAPGVSVIAAFSEAVGPTGEGFDARRLQFNSESGTSMSCPHVSGIVGLLKTAHPDWSPSAIKSAIMTTAKTRDNVDKPISNSSYMKATPFGYGAGHVWPNRAADPGLVYDIKNEDYMNFLCALGYNSTSLMKFNLLPHQCPPSLLKLEDLNYPSITVPNLNGSITVTRTVKNVGKPAVYKVRVRPIHGISIYVKPTILTFVEVGEEKNFEVTLTAKVKNLGTDYAFGSLVWSDGVHNVRSPVVVKAKG